LHHLEYIVPAEQTKKHYPKLEKLRKTGLWEGENIVGNFNSDKIVNSINKLNDTIKNNERLVRFVGDVSFNHKKYFGSIQLQQRRMAY
jgi:hypothetical protein